MRKVISGLTRFVLQFRLVSTWTIIHEVFTNPRMNSHLFFKHVHMRNSIFSSDFKSKI